MAIIVSISFRVIVQSVHQVFKNTKTMNNNFYIKVNFEVGKDYQKVTSSCFTDKCYSPKVTKSTFDGKSILVGEYYFHSSQTEQIGSHIRMIYDFNKMNLGIPILKLF